jgi:membrane dipeptidase
MRFTLPFVLALVGCRATTTPTPLAGPELLEQARAMHGRIITIDTHDDIPFNFATPEVDPLDADRQVNLEKMRAGGLDVAFFIVFVGQTPRTPENYEKAKADAMTKFDAIHRMTRMYPNLIELAYTPADVRRISTGGKLVAAIGIENGYVIGKDLSLIRKYYDLGARYMTLAHSQNNDICDSSTDPRGPEHNGVSAFGREVAASRSSSSGDSRETRSRNRASRAAGSPRTRSGRVERRVPGRAVARDPVCGAQGTAEARGR